MFIALCCVSKLQLANHCPGDTALEISNGAVTLDELAGDGCCSHAGGTSHGNSSAGRVLVTGRQAGSSIGGRSCECDLTANLHGCSTGASILPEGVGAGGQGETLGAVDGGSGGVTSNHGLVGKDFTTAEEGVTGQGDGSVN